MNELIQIGPISPLRQRLIDDMAFRRFKQETSVAIYAISGGSRPGSGARHTPQVRRISAGSRSSSSRRASRHRP